MRCRRLRWRVAIASLCNVIGSHNFRYTGNGAYLHAGPEYSVASTKAFTNMVAALLLFALTISDRNNSTQMREIIQQLRELPNRVSAQLRMTTVARWRGRPLYSRAPPLLYSSGGGYRRPGGGGSTEDDGDSLSPLFGISWWRIEAWANRPDRGRDSQIAVAPPMRLRP